MKKQFSKKHIVYYRQLIDAIGLLFWIIFIAFLTFDQKNETLLIFSEPQFIIVFSIAFVVIYFILYIYRILYWKKSGYYLTDTQICTYKGIIFKKKSFLDYNKIHAINKKQNFIQKALKISTLFVDSGSTNTAYSAEISIFETDEIVNELMKKIDLKQNKGAILEKNEDNSEIEEKDNKINLYSFTAKNKALYSLFNTLLSALAILVLMLFAAIVFIIIVFNSESLLDDFMQILIIFPSTILMIMLISLISSLIYSFIGFYNFEIFKENDTIHINYGLIQKNYNSFKVDKVKAVIIKENLIQRFFHFVSLEVEVIGYGETENNQSINRVLIPLCKKSEVNDYINKIFPKYIPLEKQDKTKDYFSMISFNILIPVIIILLFDLILSIWMLCIDEMWGLIISNVGSAVLIIIIVISVLIYQRFAYYNHGISFNDDKITVYNGALTKVSTTILKENLIGITSYTTFYRKKKGIYSYVIHFKSNSRFNTVRINSIDQGIYDKIYNLITL